MSAPAILVVNTKHGSATFRIPEGELHRILLAASIAFRGKEADKEHNDYEVKDETAHDIVKEIRRTLNFEEN